MIINKLLINNKNKIKKTTKFDEPILGTATSMPQNNIKHEREMCLGVYNSEPKADRTRIYYCTCVFCILISRYLYQKLMGG